MKKTFKTIFLTAILAAPTVAIAEDNAPDSVQWYVSAFGGGSTGDFAPYLIGSNSGGRHAMKSTAVLSGTIVKDYNLDRRFSWSAGAELATGYAASADYEIYDADTRTWGARPWHPARAWIQQLWAGVKYRGVMLTAGMRDHRSPIVDDALSSGDLTLSNNARAIPSVEAGFIDFQDIPFTKGWVQIGGAIAYGKYADSDALKGRFNYYTDHITTGQYFTYKRVHFRTRPDRPLSVTIGVQVAGEFGGTTYRYGKGDLDSAKKNPDGFKAFWEMFIPKQGNGDGFFEGNHLGTWDFRGRYRLHDGIDLEGYFQWYWEDGSSMARRNMTDGLWGIQVTIPRKRCALNSILVEYVDMRNQSGPIHWAPADQPGTTITDEATGGDNYYNSSGFNAWANYGLGLGSSFPVAPLYNIDGYPQFRHCRTRGVHIAATGSLGTDFGWTAKFSHAVAWGNGRLPYPDALKNTSAMATVDWNARILLPGLSVQCSLAFDAGRLRGDNFGGLLCVKYTGGFGL